MKELPSGSHCNCEKLKMSLLMKSFISHKTFVLELLSWYGFWFSFSAISFCFMIKVGENMKK